MLFHPLRFCLSYVGLTILLFVVAIAAAVLWQFELGSSGSIVIPMCAAMFEGQKFAGKYSARPKSSAMWKAAFGMSWLALLLSVIYAAVMFAGFPELLAPLAEVPLWIFGLVLGFIIALHLLVIRLGYGLGVRNGLRGLKTT